MLVLIKSAPDTTEAIRAVLLAKEMSANIVLLQNGVYLAGNPMLDGVAGTVFALKEDMQMRAVDNPDPKRIGYDDLVDLMADDEKVVGMF
jgi:sulfur relay protein TusB/DsrH